MASSQKKKKKQQRGGGGGVPGGGGESRVSSWSSSSPSMSHENGSSFWDLTPGTSKNCCFVTVGTTSFDLLTSLFIHPEDSSIYEPLFEQLMRLKVTHLVVQRGRGYGIYHGEHMMLEKDNDNVIYKIPYSTFGIADSIEEIFFNSDIVITHAGAGSIFEALSFGKKVIAVTNPGLMGNHQAELADELAKRRHIVTVHGPENLVDALKTVDLDALEPYVPGNPAMIANEINKLIGDYPL
ncbi:glycosyltransferase family 28 protein [Pseudoscourfieldia marina]